MEYRIEVLRGRILHHGRRLEIQHRPLELAIVLAAHGGRLSAGAICALMYPELRPDAAAQRVRVNASRLRDAAPGLISRATVGAYTLCAHAVDIDEIESTLRSRDHDDRFLSLLRELLPLADADRDRVTPYWSWFSAVDARIDTMRSDACSVLNTMDVPTAHAEEALLVARRLIASDPIDESAYILAMRSLFVLQRRVDALRLYREYERMMRAEFDAEPSPAFDNLMAHAM